MVIISNQVLENPQSYSQQVEWDMAEKRFKFDEFYGKKSFTIIPVFIDDTPRTDPRISDFMRSFTSFHYSDRERIIEEVTHTLNPLVSQPSGV